MHKNLVFILTLGVFSILNTEMGVIGILPLISEVYGVNISTAGLLVSLFALGIAVSGPVLPLVFSKYNRKNIMILSLSVFFVCNVISAFADNFTVVMVTRVIPALLHPVYVSLAFSAAAASVAKKDAPKAIATVMIGVSAGMVLGVPIVSYIANITSLTVAMLSFAIVNFIALAITVIFVPSMPVTEKISYGSQLNILKQREVWLSLLAVIFLNGAVFSVYSYLAEYLEKVTALSIENISILLLVYGLFNIVGNTIAGRMLSGKKAVAFVTITPFLLIGVYLFMLFAGSYEWFMLAIIFIWGIMAGIVANVNQYWIISVAEHVPDFANSLYLVSGNLGITIGAFICGILIMQLGIAYIALCGIIFCLVSTVFMYIRIKSEQKEVSFELE